MAREHHSASELNMFRNCQMRHHYKYALEYPEPESSAAILGKAVHQMVDEMARGGHMLPYKAARRAVELYDSMMSEAAKSGEVERYGKKAADDDRDKRQAAVEAAKLYLTAGRPLGGETLGVSEAGFSYNLEGVRLPIVGFIDQVRIDTEGRAYPWDLKTGNRKVNSGLQLAVYQTAVAKYYPAQTAPYGVFWYSKDGVRHKVPLTSVGPGHLAAQFQNLERTVELNNPQANPGSHCWTCPFKRVCPEAWETIKE